MVAIAAMLCVWLMALASHVHAADEHAPETLCEVCVSLPSSAVAPTISKLPEVVWQACGSESDVPPPCANLPRARFYPTRGPPR